MRSQESRRAFTLVEVLVVIAIMAALAAIAFPVFARARENGRRAACKSNLHQIGLAWSMYIADHDGMDAVKGVRLTHSQLGLPYKIRGLDPYIRSGDLQFCPSGPRSRGWGSNYWWVGAGSEYDDPSVDWEDAAAARGPDYALVVCPNHNGPPDTPRSLRRSSDVLIYQVLRIDGRVTVRTTTVAEQNGGPYWW